MFRNNSLGGGLFVPLDKLDHLLSHFYPDKADRNQEKDKLINATGYYMHWLVRGRTAVYTTAIPGEFIFHSFDACPITLQQRISSKLAWMYMLPCDQNNPPREFRFPITALVQSINSALGTSWDPSVVAKHLILPDEPGLDLLTANGLQVGIGVNPVYVEDIISDSLQCLYSLAISGDFLVANWKNVVPAHAGVEIPSISLFIAGDSIPSVLNGRLSKKADIYVNRLRQFLDPFVVQYHIQYR